VVGRARADLASAQGAALPQPDVDTLLTEVWTTRVRDPSSCTRSILVGAAWCRRRGADAGQPSPVAVEDGARAGEPARRCGLADVDMRVGVASRGDQNAHCRRRQHRRDPPEHTGPVGPRGPGHVRPKVRRLPGRSLVLRNPRRLLDRNETPRRGVWAGTTTSNDVNAVTDHNGPSTGGDVRRALVGGVGFGSPDLGGNRRPEVHMAANTRSRFEHATDIGPFVEGNGSPAIIDIIDRDGMAMARSVFESGGAGPTTSRRSPAPTAPRRRTPATSRAGT